LEWLMKKDFYTTYFEVEKTHWLMRGRRAIVLDMLRRHVHKSADARVLDFGCGSGLTVQTLTDAGYIASGVDFSREAIEFGTSKGIAGLQVVSDEKLPFPDASFDAVVCMDVLEHLADEQPALSEMRRVLKPEGVLLIMVPAYMFLWGTQDEVAHHYRRYTLGSLTQVVRAGALMTLEKRSYFNTLLFPLIALVRVGSWILGLRSRRESDFDLNTAFINAIFSGIFAIERRVLSFLNLPFGVSILLVARNHGDH
jgi:2-polyprenyl-3-methyl-5-hydroxy-6-metoxy-1,4-benzoquinol methylase